MHEKQKTFAECIDDTFLKIFKQDKNVIMMGLGVNDPKKIFNTTTKVSKKFPSRVFDVPISENSISGIAIGCSMNNLKPILTHQRLDFSLLTLDQIINQAAKWYYMFDGKKNVPIVIRLIVGRGWGQGPQHSQSLHSFFSHIPGLKVVMPSTNSSVISLLKASILDPNPVIFIEHRWLHGVEEHKIVKKNIKNQIGSSQKLSKGKDFTVVTYSLSTLEILALKKDLNKNNIFFDHIDLQTIKPLDLKLVKNSLKKTKKLLVLDTISHPICSVGSELISQIYLDKKIKLVKPPILLTLPDIPSPTSTFYTKDFYVSKQDIINKIKLLTNKLKNIKLSNFVAHDVPDTKFKGPF